MDYEEWSGERTGHALPTRASVTFDSGRAAPGQGRLAHLPWPQEHHRRKTAQQRMQLSGKVARYHHANYAS
jgi:hypothetical protein